VTWGNPDGGKLGHNQKAMTDQEKSEKEALYKKRGYSPRNYADYAEMDFVYGELESKKVKQVACGF